MWQDFQLADAAGDIFLPALLGSQTVYRLPNVSAQQLQDVENTGAGGLRMIFCATTRRL
jgi:ABC-type spermidine/putrescine transport system permease subunit I